MVDQVARWGWLVATVAVLAMGGIILVRGGGTGPPPAITEIGTSTVQASPDTAVVQLGVNSVGASAESAITHNDTLMAAVEKAIEQLGLPASDLQTISYNLYPQYGGQGKAQAGGAPTITGYNVSDTLQVTTSRLQLVGQVLSVGIASGANSVQNVQYEVLNQNTALSRAEGEAIAQAKAQAQTAASAMGKALGSVLSVEEIAPSAIVPYGVQYNPAASGGSPVLAGTQPVSVTVKVVFAVR